MLRAVNQRFERHSGVSFSRKIMYALNYISQNNDTREIEKFSVSRKQTMRLSLFSDKIFFGQEKRQAIRKRTHLSFERGTCLISIPGSSCIDCAYPGTAVWRVFITRGILRKMDVIFRWPTGVGQTYSANPQGLTTSFANCFLLCMSGLR